MQFRERYRQAANDTLQFSETYDFISFPSSNSFCNFINTVESSYATFRCYASYSGSLRNSACYRISTLRLDAEILANDYFIDGRQSMRQRKAASPRFSARRFLDADYLRQPQMHDIRCHFHSSQKLQ